MEAAKPSKSTDKAAALAAIQQAFPEVTDFERDFPSLCFALATGVGKTRLMGAFISYLRLAYGLQNFFVLAPNLTIYNKLIADFTPNTPKYVFKGVAEFATEPPTIITGNPRIAKAVSDSGHKVIGWNNRSLDTVITDQSKILKRIKRKIKPGSIILLHDASDKTAQVLEQLLLFLQSENYLVIPLDELLNLKAYEN